jgi:hypothetical protein
VLKIICDTYRLSISKYIQEVLIESMTSDIDEGNFCDILLKKIKINDDDDNVIRNNSNTQCTTENSESTNDRIDVFNKLANYKNKGSQSTKNEMIMTLTLLI